MFLIFTGFLAAGYALQLPKGYDQENLILGLIYAWFCIFMIFNYIPTTTVTHPWNKAIHWLSSPIRQFSPKIISIGYAAFVAAVMVATVFALPEKEESTRVQRVISFFGLGVFIGGLYLTSNVKYIFKYVLKRYTSFFIIIIFKIYIFIYIFYFKKYADINRIVELLIGIHYLVLYYYNFCWPYLCLEHPLVMIFLNIYQFL